MVTDTFRVGRERGSRIRRQRSRATLRAENTGRRKLGRIQSHLKKTLLWPAVACLALDMGSSFERESNLKSWPPYQVENPKMKKTQGHRLTPRSCWHLPPSLPPGRRMRGISESEKTLPAFRDLSLWPFPSRLAGRILWVAGTDAGDRHFRVFSTK